MKNSILKLMRRLALSKSVEPKSPVKMITRNQKVVPFTVQQSLAGFVSNPGITTSYVESKPLRQAEPLLKIKTRKTEQELWGLSSPAVEKVPAPVIKAPIIEAVIEYKLLKPMIWLMQPHGDVSRKGIEDFEHIMEHYLKKSPNRMKRWRFSSTKTDDLSEQLFELSNHVEPYDIVVIVVGGGRRDNVFYKCYDSENTEKAIKNLQHKGAVVVAGLGHKDDVFAIDFYVDFSCITPTAAGYQVLSILSNWRSNRQERKLPVHYDITFNSPLPVIIISAHSPGHTPRGLSDIMHVIAFTSVQHLHFNPYLQGDLSRLLGKLVNTLQGAAIVAIVSGGGEVNEAYYDNFNDTTVREKVRSLQKKKVTVISGIGHAKDHFFIDRFVDHSAITPTHAGYIIGELLQTLKE